MHKIFKPLPSNPFLSLQENEVHIWQFSLQCDSHAEDLIILSEEEKARAERFYFELHRQRFIQAKAKTRRIIGQYLSIEAHLLTFETHSHGKPFLPSHPQFCFNLSHSGDLALLAVTKNHEIGIDLEFYSTRPFEGIGKHLFSVEENHALKNAHISLKPMIFFDLWTKKEAFIKAVGMGLSYPTQQLNLPILTQHIQNVEQFDIMAFFTQVGCKAAVCYHPSVTDIYYGQYE